jgi:hypothetical protein
MPACLPVCLSACLPACLPACPPARLPACLPTRLHGTTGLPLEKFLWNLIFEYFSKLCQENSSLIKT